MSSEKSVQKIDAAFQKLLVALAAASTPTTTTTTATSDSVAHALDELDRHLLALQLEHGQPDSSSHTHEQPPQPSSSHGAPRP